MRATDEELYIALAARGDAEAFAALVAPRRTRLLLLLAAGLGDWAEAEDALQEALWRAFGGLRHLREAGAFDAWLRALALNVARDHLRAAVRRHRREGAPGGDAADLERLLEAPATAAGADEAATGVLEAIACLPPLQRRIGSLAWVAGVRPREIASALGLSADHVHVTLHRARRRLGAMFYSPGDWKKGVEPVPEGTVLFAGYHGARIRDHWRTARPELQASGAEWGEAHVVLNLFIGGPSPDPFAPAWPAAATLPLDQLAEAAGLDMEPFGTRLLRFAQDGRPHWFPYSQRPEALLYNADLLRRLRMPLPDPEWTWDDFFAYCRACMAAGAPWALCDLPGLFLPAAQLGATADHPEPIVEAAKLHREWATLGVVPPTVEQWNGMRFYRGQVPLMFMQTAHPYPLFSQNGIEPFQWGLAPYPRMRRSDTHLTHWYHSALAIRSSAPDPVAAFRVAAAALTDGPPVWGAELPAYRTPEVWRAWREQPDGVDVGWPGYSRRIPDPLGKECLLTLDEQSRGKAAPWLYILPGARAVFDRFESGEASAEDVVEAVRRGAVARAAGTPFDIVNN